MEISKDKLCKKCGLVKPNEHFSTSTKTYKGIVKGYLQSYCKPCMVKNVYEWRTGKPFEEKQEKVQHTRLTPQQANAMNGPLSFKYLQGKSTKETHKVYPLCSEGHRYVGPECLPCKYAIGYPQHTNK